MNLELAYKNFKPSLISKENLYLPELKQTIENTKYVFLGEIHGATQNCDVLYSLVTHYGFSNLAVELPTKLKDFISSCIQGKPNFEIVDKVIFTASVLSVEMAKTIATLVVEGKITSIHYTDAYSEQGMANNILAINTTTPVLILTGNWHSATELMDGGKHKSSFLIVKERDSDAVNIELKYISGAIFNDGRILEFESRKGSGDYGLRKVTGTQYEISVPVATPISHDF